MHCKSAVWFRSNQTKHREMKEENWECERADFTFCGKMWRNGHLENKMERLIRKGICYMRYLKLVQIDMEMPFKGWSERNPGQQKRLQLLFLSNELPELQVY